MQELRQNVEIENCSELTFQPRIDPKSAKLATAAVNRSASAMYASTGRDENDASSANGAAEVALLYHLSADIGSRYALTYSTPARTQHACTLTPTPTTPCAHRLINEGRMQSRRKQKLMQEYELAEASLYERVRPSKGSESIARRTPSIGSLDFIERQQRFDQKLRGDVARRQQEAAAAQKELFKPAVDSRSRDIAAKARPGAANETAAEMASRYVMPCCAQGPISSPPLFLTCVLCCIQPVCRRRRGARAETRGERNRALRRHRLHAAHRQGQQGGGAGHVVAGASGEPQGQAG